MNGDGPGGMSRYFCPSNFGNFVFATSLACNSRKQEILIDNQRHKNSQETQKTAFLANQQIAPRGFEPLESNQQSSENKAFTEKANSVLSTGLDNILLKYNELIELVKVWPELPEQIKAAIEALIQTQDKTCEQTENESC